MKTFTITLSVEIDGNDDIQAKDLKELVEIDDDIFLNFNVAAVTWKVEAIKED